MLNWIRNLFRSKPPSKPEIHYAQNAPPCDECGGLNFIHIPDSLAMFCEKCGFVWVLGSGENGLDRYQKGASIQQWLEDVYGKKEKDNV